MRKIAAAVFIAAMFPALSYALTNEEIRAQIDALLAEIAQLQQLLNSITTQGAAASPSPVSTAGGSGICAVSRYPLSRGAVGRDVSLLQQFLKDRGFFSGEVTTFFGTQTETALTNFQLQSGIIETRSDGGVFGRRTFNYILGRFCTSPISTVTPTPTPAYTSPTQCITPPTIPAITCGGSWVKTYGSACHVGWTCVATTTAASATPSNKPPLISAIVGPTLLKPEEAGTWKVDATDPEQGGLSYSMVWGDEGVALPQILNIAREGTKYSSTTSYTHAYAKTGAYTIVAFAKDPADNDTSAVLAVQVRSPEPPPSTPSHGSGDSCTLNGATTAHTAVIPNPTCSGTCSYPYLQCISGQWVALSSATASGAQAEGNHACYMDGKGYDAEKRPEDCAQYDSIGNPATPPEKCKKYLDATPVCTSQGWSGNLWAGGYISLPFPAAVGCTAANEFVSPYTTSRKFYVPGNMKVLGGWCTAEEGVNRMDCDGYFVCKRDGWWMLDGAGNEFRKLDRAPSLGPEQFYPQF